MKKGDEEMRVEKVINISDARVTGEESGVEGFEQRHVTEDARVKEISPKLSMYENAVRTHAICRLTYTDESYVSEPIRFDHYFFIKISS